MKFLSNLSINAKIDVFFHNMCLHLLNGLFKMFYIIFCKQHFPHPTLHVLGFISNSSSQLHIPANAESEWHWPKPKQYLSPFKEIWIEFQVWNFWPGPVPSRCRHLGNGLAEVSVCQSAFLPLTLSSTSSPSLPSFRATLPSFCLLNISEILKFRVLTQKIIYLKWAFFFQIPKSNIMFQNTKEEC